MKWIKYNVLQNTINVGTESEPVYEDVLLEKRIGYCPENLIIAQDEAYNGEYTIEEEDINFKAGVCTSWAFSSYLSFVGNVNAEMVAAAFGKGNENNVKEVGAALALYAKYKGETEDIDYLFNYDKFVDLVYAHKDDLINNSTLYDLISSSSYANDILINANSGKSDVILYDKGDTEYLDIANATIYDWTDNTYYQKYDWADCSSSLNTDGNISIYKSAATNGKSVLAYKCTIPLLKSLPSLKGYRYLHVKLSDTEESYCTKNYFDNSFTLNVAGVNKGIASFSCEDSKVTFTGESYVVDLFSDYVKNPSADNVVIGLNLCSFSNNASSLDSRSTKINIHIDKIWISET